MSRMITRPMQWRCVATMGDTKLAMRVLTQMCEQMAAEGGPVPWLIARYKDDLTEADAKLHRMRSHPFGRVPLNLDANMLMPFIVPKEFEVLRVHMAYWAFSEMYDAVTFNIDVSLNVPFIGRIGRTMRIMRNGDVLMLDDTLNHTPITNQRQLHALIDAAR